MWMLDWKLEHLDGVMVGVYVGPEARTLEDAANDVDVRPGVQTLVDVAGNWSERC